MSEPGKNSAAAHFPWHRSIWQSLAAQWRDGRLAHAFLVYGPHGCGKTRLVHSLARYMHCSQPGPEGSCGDCHACRQGGAAPHPDTRVVTPMDGSRDIKIDQVRNLEQFMRQTSHAGGPKIGIIAPADRMNVNSANALLKTLEEPTPNSFLFLVSDYPGALPITVRSRCLKLLLPHPSDEELERWLRERLDGDLHVDLPELVLAAKRSPMLALSMAADDSWQARGKLLGRLGQLRRGQVSLRETVSLAQDLAEPATIIGYLTETASILVKHLVAGKQEVAGDRAGSELLASLEPVTTGPAERLRGLLDVHRQAARYAALLRSGSNPNPQLLIESLLWRWSLLP